MHLSKKMAFTLRGFKDTPKVQHHRGDGNTLKALARRGFLKALRWDHHERCYAFRLSVQGRWVKRVLKGLGPMFIRKVL